MNLKKEVFLNQNCAEMMIKKAARLILGSDLDFAYTRDIQDIQVDLGPAFMFSPDEEKTLWVSGKNQETLEKDLATLNKSSVYFFRTGTQGGAGHWQVLYYEAAKSGWVSYSSQSNHFQVTDSNGKLTASGKGLLVPHANWGKENGNYAFLLVNASAQNIIHAANFVYILRTQNEVAAIEYCALNHKFHPEIKRTARAKAEPETRTKGEIHNLPKDLSCENLKTIYSKHVALLNVINRLEAGSKSYNPYWMGSQAKLNTILGALGACYQKGLDVDSELSNSNSELSKAINIRRLPSLFSFWGGKNESPVESRKIIDESRTYLRNNP
ncbi:TPA: Dot/Icm T4SS effector deubiquitinase RavD [Legionella pneumophila]